MSKDFESTAKKHLIRYGGEAPKALSILMDLAENSASDSVKFQASKDLLDRAGFFLSIGEKRFDLNALLQN